MAPNGNKDTILREHKVVAVEWGEGQSLYQGTYHSSVGVLSLFSYQRTSRTIMVVEQIYIRKPTGLFLLSYIEDLILEAGVYGTLWKISFKHISRYFMYHSLIYHTCYYNVSNGIHLSVVHGEMKLQREGDMALMSISVDNFTDTKDLRSIQRVRSQLGMVHVSDVCSADGIKMDRFFVTTYTSKYRNIYD